MNDFLLYAREAGDSVVKESLTTAADDQNCRGEQYRALAKGPLSILYTLCRESRLPDLYAMFPNWNALRAELSWALSPVVGHLDKGDGMVSHASEFNRAERKLYSAVADKESLSVQAKGKIDVSCYASVDHFRGITKMIVCGKRRASDRFATRRVANSIVAARKATTEKSSAVQIESKVSDHFLGVTKMVEPCKNGRCHHDGR